jgi:hypothetical protein
LFATRHFLFKKPFGRNRTLGDDLSIESMEENLFKSDSKDQAEKEPEIEEQVSTKKQIVINNPIICI